MGGGGFGARFPVWAVSGPGGAVWRATVEREKLETDVAHTRTYAYVNASCADSDCRRVARSKAEFAMETQAEMDAALALLAAQAAEVEDEEVRAVVMQGVGAFLDAVTKAAAQHNAMIEEVARAHGLTIAPAMLLSVPQIVCASFFAAIVRLEVDRVEPQMCRCAVPHPYLSLMPLMANRALLRFLDVRQRCPYRDGASPVSLSSIRGKLASGEGTERVGQDPLRSVHRLPSAGV